MLPPDCISQALNAHVASWLNVEAWDHGAGRMIEAQAFEQRLTPARLKALDPQANVYVPPKPPSLSMYAWAILAASLI